MCPSSHEQTRSLPKWIFQLAPVRKQVQLLASHSMRRKEIPKGSMRWRYIAELPRRLRQTYLSNLQSQGREEVRRLGSVLSGHVLGGQEVPENANDMQRRLSCQGHRGAEQRRMRGSMRYQHSQLRGIPILQRRRKRFVFLAFQLQDRLLLHRLWQ